MRRIVSGNGWVIGLAVMLALLLVATRLIQPNFGVTGLDSLSRAVLPFAFATAAMAVVVIAGGIDLSVASMMAVTSVTAATLMDGTGELASVGVVLFVLVVGFSMGALNGALIVVTRVPDIVATLAMLYVWEGVALLVLEAPGGAAAGWLRSLISGGVTLPLVPDAATEWLPRSTLLMAVVIAAIWMPIRRARLGLSIYAVGSDAEAAYRSGVPVARTRILAYALCGLLSACGGLSLTMSTGIGEPIPGPYLLAAVAGVVLGGVVLGGGRGGILGPVIAVAILRLVRLDLTLLSVDPNVTTIIEGTIMVVVVMLGGLIAVKGRRR